jgi:carbamoyl-phosphate synthase small subunit
MAGADLAREVSTDTAYVVPAAGERRFVVAAVDLGIKGMTPTLMAKEGIEVHVLPASATLDDVLEVGRSIGQEAPDGVFFSNGPGDPATADVSVLQAVLAADSVLRDLLRQPVARAGARIRHV